MDKPPEFSKRLHYCQLALYAIGFLFLSWELLSHEGLTSIWGLYSGSCLLILSGFLLAGSFVLTIRNPRLGARCAFVASALSLIFYIVQGILAFSEMPYDVFDITRFYFWRILIIGSSLVCSQQILRSSQERAEGVVRILFFKFQWKPSRLKFVLILGVLLCSTLGIQWLFPRVSCSLHGGQWVRGGIIGQAEYCLYRYSDAGKPCKNSEDCQGTCILPINYKFMYGTPEPFFWRMCRK